MLLSLVLIVTAYLLGSVSSAIIVCRLLGLPDPRTEGSLNPGTTNVLRLGGKGAALVTLLGDMLKGLLPMLAAKLAGVEPGVLAAVGLAAFLGHLYPIFFRFQGGKGVATALGVFLGLSWWVGGALIATWLFMAVLFRISSLAALVSFLLAPVYVALWVPDRELLASTVIMSILSYWRHRTNIRNLLAGNEEAIGSGVKKG